MENQTKPVSVKLGVMLTNKNGNKTIKLGSTQEGDKAKYNYTVQVRVLDANGNVVHKAENPWVTLKEVNKGAIDYELQVFKNTEV